LSKGRYFYTAKDNRYYIKLTGRLRYDISSGFNRFLTEILSRNDCTDFLIDLTEAEYLDSTNLGLIAKIAQYMRKCGKKAKIVSVNKDLNKILCSVGFDDIFIIINKPETIEATLNEVENINEDERAFVKMMLDAHKTLAEISEKNMEKFKGVIELMAKKYK
jgi:anti-anti-sigma factor